MQRLIQLSAILAAGFILWGLRVMPDTTLMMLVGHSQFLVFVRLAIIVCMTGLFLSRPPRSLVFRAVLGVMALGLLGWTSYGAYNEQFPVLDALLFMIAGISFAIAALEYNPKDEAAKYGLGRTALLQI